MQALQRWPSHCLEGQDTGRIAQMHRSIVAAAIASASLLAPLTARAQYNAQVQVQVQPYQPQGQVYVQQQVAPPPPPNAVAGDGQYVAPMQQQTQQTYVPQS